MEIKAEIRERRDRDHLHLLDAAVRLERETGERVRIETAITPASYERVVLPMFEIGDKQWRARKSQDQPVILKAYYNVSVPRIGVATCVLRERS